MREFVERGGVIKKLWDVIKICSSKKTYVMKIFSMSISKNVKGI